MQLPTYSMYAHLFKRKSNILLTLVDVLSEVYLICLCAKREGRERKREREIEREREREKESERERVHVFVCCEFVC